ncbi:extracellular calcium-sensing receptor-like [Ambystoma mexicanum]|uniref:extracellular calcium-sensing receptor-like n=1 Tax=Ambystoma mexicanum TaxID=8296 RepID=UPI0037E8C0C3
MAFAIDEINHDQEILPNITLGFLITDTCLSMERLLHGTLGMLTGVDLPIVNYRCQYLPPLAAIVGDSSSTRSIPMARLLGLYRHPQVSYAASSPQLSEKVHFPSFLRTMPSGNTQALAIAQLVVHFKWTWVGILSTDNDYGEMGSRFVMDELLRSGICIAFHEIIPIVISQEKVTSIVKVVKKSTASVIIVYATEPYRYPVINELSKHKLMGKVWIDTDSGSLMLTYKTKEVTNMMSGTLGIGMHSGSMPGFKDFLLKIRPSASTNDIFLKPFWEEAFGCQWSSPGSNLTLRHRDVGNRMQCSSDEDLKILEKTYLSNPDLRASSNVYKAVHAIAQALKNLALCVPGKGSFPKGKFVNVWSFEPWQLWVENTDVQYIADDTTAVARYVTACMRKAEKSNAAVLLHYMKNVRFKDKNGEDMFFDSSGDPPALFDITNLQIQPDGSAHDVIVGSFTSGLSMGQQLHLNRSTIRWNTFGAEVPRSVCSDSCAPGTRKASRKGQASCCFDCIPCAAGEFSNETDSINCWPCSSDQWSSENGEACVPKIVEFLSYQEPLGATLTGVVVFCSFLTSAISLTFVRYRNTPIVKANNRGLTYLLLGTLMLSFLCSLLFIGLPNFITCLLRQAAFGVLFTLCVSCVLAKTVIVVIAFSATKPNSNKRRWLGPWVPVFTVSGCTLGQILICAIWLLHCPPFPEENLTLKMGTIIFQCNECSETAFWCMVGYMGFFACVSFLVAFMSRGLPDSFNESKWITFSMLVFLSVWLSFVPGYLSTKGKYTVAIEVFGIISSSAGLLCCIFLPKCHIIFLRPQLNTKKHLLGRRITICKT